ncbi:MAG: hypothetical protein ACLQAH_05765 [Limisphaerales bacterium]
MIEGENSHDAHSFATKARRGEPISIPQKPMTRISPIFTDSIRVNPCNPCLKERWTETGGQNKVENVNRDELPLFSTKFELHQWMMTELERKAHETLREAGFPKVRFQIVHKQGRLKVELSGPDTGDIKKAAELLGVRL